MNEVSNEDKNRQQFITEKLLDYGKVTYEEISTRFGSVSRQQLKTDAIVLRKKGVSIENALDKRKGLFYSPKSNSSVTYEFREQYNVDEKRQVAEALRGLLLSSKPGDLEELESKWSVKFQIPSTSAKEKLDLKLRSLLMTKSRQVFIDSGTTGAYISGIVEDFNPCDKDGVSALEIWTNGRHIFYRLGHPKCEARTAFIGGRQRFRTAAISGAIANRFVQEQLPLMDLFLIGASAITMNEPYVFSGNAEDAELKRLIMDGKAKLSVVAVDSSKFTCEAFGEKVCSLSADGFVDMIVTDGGFKWDECPIPVMIKVLQRPS